jgi:DNA-binding response OmpR family regulator
MSCRILIVENEDDVRELLRSSLSEYELEEESAGSKLFSRLEMFRPQVILADNDMPDMDIDILLERVQRMEDPPQVILITDQDSQDEAIEDLRSGAHDYLLKPLQSRDIRRRVSRAVERQRAMVLPNLRSSLSGLSEEAAKKTEKLLAVISDAAEVEHIACLRIMDLVKNLKNFAKLDEADRKPFDIRAMSSATASTSSASMGNCLLSTVSRIASTRYS